MSFSTNLSVADRLALALEGLARGVAGLVRGRVMSAAMIVLVWQRLRRVERDVLGLLARFRAGRLRVMPGRLGVSRAGGSRWGRLGLPRRFAWLLPMMPGEAACFAGQIRTMLAEPEMVALMSVSPQARRVLRPVCRMLGIEREVLRPLGVVVPEVADLGSPVVSRVDGSVGERGALLGEGMGVLWPVRGEVRLE
jgi:hypothetical protein